MQFHKVALGVTLGLVTAAATALQASAQGMDGVITPPVPRTLSVKTTSGTGGFIISFINPCAPQDGVVSVTGTVIAQIRTLADGTQLDEEHSALTGTSATGVRYQYNVQFKGDPYTDKFDQVVEEISLGPSANARIHATETDHNGTVTCTGAGG